MRGGLFLLALPALLLLSTPLAAKEAAWPSGIYSNVRMSGQTGDLGGMEARFYNEAGQPMVEFVWCEGWCNTAYTSEVMRKDDGFTFGYIEVIEGGEGRIENNYSFLVRLVGKRIAVTAWMDGTKIDYNGDKPWMLKPAKEEFGLDVAKPDKGEEPNPAD